MKVSEDTKQKIRYTYMYFLKHPKQYMQFYYTGRVVPATYRWKRNIERKRHAG